MQNPGSNEPTPTSESAPLAEAVVTTPANEWTAPVDADTKRESFEENVRKMVEDGSLAIQRHVDRDRVALADIGNRLTFTLNDLGRALHKLEVVRKDHGAMPEVISSCAAARRELEAEANKLMNEYVSTVVRQLTAKAAAEKEKEDSE